MTSVLVTGTTGFIGREIASRLLLAGRPVIALARSKDGVKAGDRVARCLDGVPGGNRVDVVEHTLGADRLDADTLRRVRREVETVIHCAGDTAFFAADPAVFRAGHLDGPVALLTDLAGGRLRRWVQVSTAFVCGARDGRVLESDGDVGQTFRNPYERVKLEAEGAVRAAGARAGVDVRVMRPSIVVGAAPPTAGGIPSGLFFEFIRLVGSLVQLVGTRVALRIPGRPRAPFNIVPVEYVAAAIVALADHPGASSSTCHLVVSDAPDQEVMLRLITERLGLEGLRLVEGALHDPTPFEARISRMMAPYRPYLEQDVRFDDSTARRLLDACGVPRPALDAPSVHRLVDLALTGGTGRPPRTGART